MANSGRNGVVSSFTLCCKTSWGLVTAQENPGKFCKVLLWPRLSRGILLGPRERSFFFGWTADLSQARARWEAWDVTLTSLWGRAGHSRGDSALGPESRCKSGTAVSGSNHRCMGLVVGPHQSTSVRPRAPRRALGRGNPGGEPDARRREERRAAGR